jgi:hypothetical protein
MKSLFPCTPIFDLSDPPSPVTSPSATTNTSAAAPPISSPSWSRRPDDTSPAQPLIARAAQFALVIQDLVAAYPFARHIHLVMDNLNIHCRKSLTDHLGEQEGRYLWSRLKVHYTPKHGSWLNQAEIELSLVSRQCLGNRRIPKLKLLKSEIKAWNTRADHHKTRIQWKFTRKAARVKFGYERNISKRSQT